MTPAAVHTFARAGQALRFAEALAGTRIAGMVGAESDTPPADESKIGAWFTDWVKRARETLGRAYEGIANATEQAREAAKQRAAAVGRALREASEALKQVSPLHAATSGLNSVRDAAKSLEGLAQAALPIALILALLWLLNR